MTHILRFRIILPPLLAALLSACAAAAPNWVNPDLPQEQWAKDYSACRRWAEDQVSPAYDEAVDGRSSNPFRQMDRDRNKKQASAMTAYCMTERGYVKKPDGRK